MEVVQVQDLWKRFRIPHEKRTTILENLAGYLQVLGGRRFTYEEFWALKGVSFAIKSGQSMGIIGENGSGKSTLLRLIARILRPDKGIVKTHGTIAPILELGLGFHGDLTVTENALVYGTIIGLRRRELKKRMDSILEFSGIERFRDAKLKNLSSGMQMRLAFAVAIETNPDIFLIDEALAVGDMEFGQKCLAKFREFKSNGKSLVLVSHALGLVKDFCENAILLSRGEIVALGNVQDVIDEYVRQVKAKAIPQTQ